MTDQELLQAMSQMMDQKLEPINKRLNSMDDRLNSMDDRLSKLEEDMEEVRDATNYTAEWIEKLEKAFQNHVVKGESK